ncbi:hypothetical protein A3A93_05925 [Candidatus Roizmanbacteria bacterium RIFCSPLOWO2_01_FULL_38_12]|uniref:Uncharacterized protein n=1 Tax=Candidatus Roizmanbacteria bacterium RIFCSPLOWO2_01_FULL_38_12 TaxID=1802061 RepID=A0A1F7IVA8_9BACT|nr:MAG: hypothetical protein A2861_02925 [Candidatus Roizmanbacteria bacterium RIFCSPHIGHO2_01_FULL_38_15]OGK36256.1 MAG: hypothetical protein A3F59_00065 [Candidatus Roizmanbacteria bacterium RIFCSPHIGHO2_12_FULL_38_13]OGK47296.1 MAG: hypothetical protein A3A93_05925 [Candidatus Roizmanbacteria bacterium RIFCSPLOWO2_01_FULL_38_12]
MTKTKPTSPKKATTQSFIGIEDVRDDVMLMKDFSAVTVIEIGAVNFWLLSAEDQTAMIYSYASLLNSLSFPVQIVIVSKMMNISLYLDYVESLISTQKDERMKARLEDYREYIKGTVKKNTVLEKRFFFCIPFNPLELGVTGIKAKGFGKEYIYSRAKTSLYPKRDHLLRLLSKVGLKPTVLQKQELTELFYNIYNPSATGRQLAPVDTYTDVVLTSG